jgi:hypothetical protein
VLHSAITNIKSLSKFWASSLLRRFHKAVQNSMSKFRRFAKLTHCCCPWFENAGINILNFMPYSKRICKILLLASDESIVIQFVEVTGLSFHVGNILAVARTRKCKSFGSDACSYFSSPSLHRIFTPAPDSCSALACHVTNVQLQTR